MLSEFNALVYGVPQCCIYTIPLEAILGHYNIMYFIYADDIQLYCSFDLKSFKDVLGWSSDCISDIGSWMFKNKLKIIDDKNKCILITFHCQNCQQIFKFPQDKLKLQPPLDARALGSCLIGILMPYVN